MNNSTVSTTEKAPRKDLFNGNVQQPGGFIFYYILIAMLIIGPAILLAILSRPYDEAQLQYASVAFENYDMAEDTLNLYLGDEELQYRIVGFEAKVEDGAQLLERMMAGESFNIGYKLYEHAVPQYYAIRVLEEGSGESIISLDDSHDYDWSDVGQLYMILGVMAALAAAYISGSIYVGRHSEKFGRWIIRMFFKEGYVKNYKGAKK